MLHAGVMPPRGPINDLSDGRFGVLVLLRGVYDVSHLWNPFVHYIKKPYVLSLEQQGHGGAPLFSKPPTQAERVIRQEQREGWRAMNWTRRRAGGSTYGGIQFSQGNCFGEQHTSTPRG